MNTPIIKIIKVKSPQGDGYETVAAEQISAYMFKLIENPILACRINYGTTVRVVAEESGDLVVTKVIRASQFRTRQFMLPPQLTEAELREQVGIPIIEAGGDWEIVFGGVVFVHIPKSSQFDLDALFKQLDYFPIEIIDDTKSSA